MQKKWILKKIALGTFSRETAAFVLLVCRFVGGGLVVQINQVRTYPKNFDNEELSVLKELRLR